MPRLDLDWEQGAFRGLLAIARRFRSDPGDPHPGRVEFEQIHSSLAVLTQLLVGYPVRVQVGRGVGGVRGSDLLFPAEMNLASDALANRELFTIRACVSAAMLRLSLGSTPPRDRIRNALASLRLARAAVDLCAREWPRFQALHEAAAARALATRPPLETFRGLERAIETVRRDALKGGHPWEDPALLETWTGKSPRGPRSPGIAIWGEWIPDLDRAKRIDAPDEIPSHESPKTQRDAPATQELRNVELKEKDRQSAVPVHVFEKAEALDRYRGGARDVDGADELEAHLDALQEVDLGELFRGNEPAHSVLRADLGLGVDIPDAGEEEGDVQGIPYDEWDVRRRQYRPGWCTVYPSAARETDRRFSDEVLRRQSRLVDRLRRRMEIQRTGLRPAPRQLEGEDVDLAALVDAHSQRLAGLQPDPRLYIRQEKRRRDVATTVLLDLSLSTDAWIEDRRVLDVSREAVLVLGEVGDCLGDRLCVLGFASQTRNRCHVWEIKGWKDSWALGKARIGALVPRGYTRLGPALRHATQVLAREPAERRLLIVITDGKPTDFDRYEGPYGIADVRQAVREAATLDVRIHALAVDSVARDTLPSLFGPGAWNVLPHIQQLPEALTTVYGRMTAR